MAYRNTKYYEFCINLYKYIFCCKKRNSSNFPCALFLRDGLDERSHISESSESSGSSSQKVNIKFYAKGVCMYPCIMPGDILHIEVRKVEEVKIGDVVVYRRYGNLFGHRIIGKGDDKGLNYIVTRPDTARLGNDGISFGRDILGVVSKIERKGIILDTAKKEFNLLKKIGLSLFFQCYFIRQRLFSLFMYIISYLQQLQPYSKIAGLLLIITKRRISFSILVPINIEAVGRFNRKISAQELIDLNINISKSSISSWMIALDVNSRQAAFLTFIFRTSLSSFSGWWLDEAKIMFRYRGTKIEEELFTRAKELLKDLRISQIYVFYSKDAYFEKMLLKNNIVFVSV